MSFSLFTARQKSPLPPAAPACGVENDRPPGPCSILHLEDSREDAVLIRDTLRAEGVDCRFVHARDRGEFVAALGRQSFDLILADHALPSFDGLAAGAPLLRRTGRSSVIAQVQMFRSALSLPLQSGQMPWLKRTLAWPAM